jgi:hypothetical protein
MKRNQIPKKIEQESPRNPTINIAIKSPKKA